MTNATSQDTAPYGGYSLTGIKEAGGEETPRFEAVITLAGRRVMHVSNDGCGGCHRYQPVSKDYVAFREQMRAFEDAATRWRQNDPHAGIEDADSLVYRLLEVAELNRKRTPVFLIDDESYWTTGVARGLRATSHDEAVSCLRGVYPGRNARLWDRSQSEFVPVD